MLIVFKAHHKPLILPMCNPSPQKQGAMDHHCQSETSILAEKKDTASDCIELTAKLWGKK